MTFSIIAHDPESGDLGIAVASKFPNVGVVIPFAKAGVGAIATQSYCNTSFGPRGLALLENGASPAQVIEILIATDPNREDRQVGVVDAQGRSATFTGQHCFDWCGGVTGPHFAAQGNTLACDAVVSKMVEVVNTQTQALPERLLAALSAGQAAGGDRRGQQSAALLVVRAGGGYAGFDDRYAAISVYDHVTPVVELQRLYGVHQLTYFRSDPARLRLIDPALATELQQLLSARGFYSGPIDGAYGLASKQALHDFMGWENYDARMREDEQIDLDVLADMRVKHAHWLAEHAPD